MIHTLSVLVENKPGALVRVCQLFARRGYNIESLAVGPTERHDVSCDHAPRRTATQQPLEQIEKQMHKLVNVLRVRELEPGEAVERELALITIAAPPERRAELMALADVFQARVADVGPETLVFEIVGEPEEVDSFEELVRPHGIRELVRTGRIGLSRASVRRHQRRQRVLQLAERSSFDGDDSPRTATSRCSTARWPSSATAARATPTPSTCTTPASRSRSACARAARSRPAAEDGGARGRRRRRGGPGRAARLAAAPRPGAAGRLRGATSRPNLEPRRRAFSSRTASTSTTAASRRRPGTT